MASSFGPKFLRGAIIGMETYNPLASIIVFQYNPETMTRSLTASQPATSGGKNPEAQRVNSPPKESISLQIDIDATDQLEVNSPLARSFGIHPQLTALEMLLYPKIAQVIAGEALMMAGAMEIARPEAPVTLFVWGPMRICPVKLTSVSVTEEAFDQLLNPIRAKVSLSLDVLTTAELPKDNLGYPLYVAYQTVKESVAGALATAGNASNAMSLMGVQVF